MAVNVVETLLFTSFDEIEALPCVTWPDRVLMPDSPGLYFVLVGTEVLYVGKSGCLRKRWHQYPLRRLFERAGPFAIAWVEISDPEVLTVTEKGSVRALRPAFNTHYVENSLEHWHRTHARFRKAPPADA